MNGRKRKQGRSQRELVKGEHGTVRQGCVAAPAQRPGTRMNDDAPAGRAPAIWKAGRPRCVPRAEPIQAPLLS